MRLCFISILAVGQQILLTPSLKGVMGKMKMSYFVDIAKSSKWKKENQLGQIPNSISQDSQHRNSIKPELGNRFNHFNEENSVNF